MQKYHVEVISDKKVRHKIGVKNALFAVVEFLELSNIDHDFRE